MKNYKDTRNPYHRPLHSDRVGATTRLMGAVSVLAVAAVMIVQFSKGMVDAVPVPRHIAYPGEAPRLLPRNGDIRMILQPSGDTLSLMYYQGQWYDLEEQSGSDYSNDPQGLKKL